MGRARFSTITPASGSFGAGPGLPGPAGGFAAGARRGRPDALARLLRVAVVISLLLPLAGCSVQAALETGPADRANLPSGVSKFSDGEVVCYVYDGPGPRPGAAISCVVLPRRSETR